MRRVFLGAAFVALAGCASGESTESSSAAVTVCGQTTVKGVDVYHGDNASKPINWMNVKSAGMSFAFAKATESTDYTDSSFSANWTGIKAAGMVRGAYHFFHSDVDPVAQAKYFLGVVGAVEPGDLLVLDLESANGQTQTTISANAATFMSTVEAMTGTTPLLYVSPAFLSSYTAFGSYPLWVANYGVSCPDVPAPWKTYTFWQSTGTGSLSALTGAVDLDTFNGTLAQLGALGHPDAGSPTEDASTDSGANDAMKSADVVSDAASDDAQLPPNGEPDEPGGGCSCDVARKTRGESSALAFLFAIAAIARRRLSRTRQRD